jgi:hypothetical protein
MTYPTIRPELTLDFANSRQLDPRITFSRSSSATYLNPDTGLITTASDYEARFEEDGLLIEESRTNTFLNSSDCTLWDPFRATVGTDTGVITAPDGSNSVGWFENSVGINGSRLRGGTVVDGTVPSSLFVWLKARSGSPWIAVGPGQPGLQKQNVFFNLSTGEQGQRGGELVGDVNIYPWPNGWYKIVFTGVTPVNVGQALSVWAADYDGQANEDYTILSSYYCWGAQVEDAASFPTSYIPTTSSIVTRAVDIAQITGDNFSSWYNQSEGTVFSDAKITFNDANVSQFPSVYLTNNFPNRLWSLLVLSTTNAITIGADAFSNNFGTGVSSPQTFKVAQAISNTTSTYSASKDGGAVITGSVSAVADQTLIRIGSETGGTKLIKRLSYYSRRLTDSELETLTL